MNKINNLLNDILKYKDYNMADNIKDRLDKVLKAYLIELDNSYSRLRCKKNETVYKELSR